MKNFSGFVNRTLPNIPFIVYEKSAKQGSDDRQLSLGFRSDLILRCLQYFRALGDGLMDQLVLTPEPLIITTSPSPVLWPLFSQGPSTPRHLPTGPTTIKSGRAPEEQSPGEQGNRGL